MLNIRDGGSEMTLYILSEGEKAPKDIIDNSDSQNLNRDIPRKTKKSFMVSKKSSGDRSCGLERYDFQQR